MQVSLQHNGCSHVFRAVLSPCLDVGAPQTHADGPTTFGVQSRYRAMAREAFVRWDCGEPVRRAALRKAAPVVGSYQFGDVDSCCRDARAGEHGLQWSVGSRLTGFQKEKTASAKHNHGHVG